ncbi:PLP-dependent transferase [Choiromyces venosus 120613-1]|uniref:PLP-dependent transferase n=1 Tax=Choiromyces venosus 120613-1 TaxID=1336337 RepID=A0A3N4JG40_9PEZI|nr:PLP-dependent transferase [Choiromyces venosus 120613-1]
MLVNIHKPINLLRGHPSTRLLATDLIRESAAKVLSSDLPQDSYARIRHPLHYGPDQGNEDLRAEIGRWSAERYGLKKAIPAERINITPGASYGLMNTLLLCTSPGTGYTKQAFVVSPTYFLAASVFEDAGFSGKLTAIRLSKNTIDIGSLVSHLERISASTPDVQLPCSLRPISRASVPKRIYKFVMYCVPTYANPTGETWDLETRRQVVEIARKWDMLIISDDVYDFLSNDGDTSALTPDKKLMPRLVTLDHEIGKKQGMGENGAGYTVSNCSFSKLLGPGLRCGWIESATGVLAKQMGEGGANHSGGAPSHFTSTLIYPLITSRSIDSVISNLTKTYTARSAAIIATVKTYFPEETIIYGGKGGFFIWIILPDPYDAREITKLAAKDVIVLNGDKSECPGDTLGWGDHCIRVAVSYCELDVAVEGIQKFAEAMKRWESGDRSSPAAEIGTN